MTIYRFKLSKVILDELIKFANIHRYDDTISFRENWDYWVNDNIEIIRREEYRLKELGYTRNIKIKMYKSVRYYFKNKSMTAKEPAERREYITINKRFLEKMDIHINGTGLNIKPSEAFTEFIDKYKKEMETEKLTLISKISDKDIMQKFKKTYKNRYFIKQKQ